MRQNNRLDLLKGDSAMKTVSSVVKLFSVNTVFPVSTLPVLAAGCLACFAAWSQAAEGETMPAVKDLPVRIAMPDPLVLDDGQKITTPEQWAKHREQMKQILEHYALGHRPPPPGNVKGREIQFKSLADGKVTYRLVHLTFGPEDKLGFDVAIFVPAESATAKAPFPTIVQPSFSPTPGVPPAMARIVPGRGPASLDPADAAKQYAEPLRRGYAIVTFYYQQCGADKPDYRKSGFFPAYPGYDWGDLAAWAWSMSRCVDYLQTQSFADKTKLIAVGHSRLGKTALVAGAFDERFALTAPAGSGCGGTGAYRFNGKGRGGKEGLEDATKNFPQWFGPHLAEFAGHVEKLPFDQHWLMALIAPRLFIAVDGLDDGATNGKALAQAYQAARPVYAFLGVPDHLGINFRPGRHMLAPADWEAILDFSDKYLRQLDVTRRFDQIPPMDQLH
jgi:hypothetical protein